jgi:hypothetical protein
MVSPFVAGVVTGRAADAHQLTQTVIEEPFREVLGVGDAPRVGGILVRFALGHNRLRSARPVPAESFGYPR